MALLHARDGRVTGQHGGFRRGQEEIRLGFVGDEYELLTNNCCYFSDHLIKLLLKDTDVVEEKTCLGCQKYTSPGARLCRA
jgi:hypothetical protein